jgi:hypothetical protein
VALVETTNTITITACRWFEAEVLVIAATDARAFTQARLHFTAASGAASGSDENFKQIGVRLYERGRSLRTGKSVRVIRF